MLQLLLGKLLTPDRILFSVLLVAAQALILVLVLLRLRERLDALEAVSSYDPLTGLRSGHHFSTELAASARRVPRLALLFIDLDDFGAHNARGHRAAGDRALRNAAIALRRAVGRKSDPIFRLYTAGDEFAVILNNASTAQALEHAERILASLKRCDLSATIGISTTEKVHWCHLEAAADHACQAQKGIAKGSICLAGGEP